ncbi:hypothetical protein [Inquilinus sp. CA228]|uniref:hypothetical protein n=1 Tax=Inquilinus sp. CA228 TaxID=3455609 RepID=UPI003F8D60FD
MRAMVVLVALAGIGLAAGAANAGGCRLEGLGQRDSALMGCVAVVKPVVVEAKGKGKGKG